MLCVFPFLRPPIDTSICGVVVIAALCLLLSMEVLSKVIVNAVHSWTDSLPLCLAGRRLSLTGSCQFQEIFVFNNLANALSQI